MLRHSPHLEGPPKRRDPANNPKKRVRRIARSRRQQADESDARVCREQLHEEGSWIDTFFLWRWLLRIRRAALHWLLRPVHIEVGEHVRQTGESCR